MSKNLSPRPQTLTLRNVYGVRHWNRVLKSRCEIKVSFKASGTIARPRALS